MDGEVVTNRVAPDSQASFRLRASGQELHREFVVGPEPRDKCRIDGVRFLDGLRVLVLDHVRLRKIQAEAQNARILRSDGTREGGNQFVQKLLSFRPVSQADV